MAKDQTKPAQRPLIEIEGIGPEYAKKLESAGYVTMEDLLQPSTTEIVEKTGISSSLVRVWQSMADVDRLETINNQYAELLVRSRITSVEQIAQASPEAIVRATGDYVATLKRAPTTQPVNEAMASEWIREARRFLAANEPGKHAGGPVPAPIPAATPTKTEAPAAASKPSPAVAPPAKASAAQSSSGETMTPRDQAKTTTPATQAAPGAQKTPPLDPPAPTSPPTPAKTAPTAGAPPPAPAGTPAAAPPAKPPVAPRPKTMTPEIESLLSGLGAKAQHLEDTDPNIPTILIDRTALIETMRRLRFEYRFDHLACLTATDMKTEFEVVYNLWSYAKNRPLEVKVRVPKTDASVPSLVGIWKGANWLEREEWDLVGVRFDGHPDHRRILLPEGWQGHPLRKDYDLKKEQFVGLADNGEDVVFQEPREGAW
jgi:NADH-quinone oxidoreductase subunit C